MEELKDGDFLKEALSVPWTLSTSQTPQNQCSNRWNPTKEHKHMLCPGGGFGPVDDDGYGVSYMFPHDDCIFVHISSKKSSPKTQTSRFRDNIAKALNMMRSSLERNMKETAAEVSTGEKKKA